MSRYSPWEESVRIMPGSGQVVRLVGGFVTSDPRFGPFVDSRVVISQPWNGGSVSDPTARRLASVPALRSRSWTLVGGQPLPDSVTGAELVYCALCPSWGQMTLDQALAAERAAGTLLP